MKLVDKTAAPETPIPVDLDLEKVLGKMPEKTFTFSRADNTLQPLALPDGTTTQAAVERVLRLPSVCSKRFLTTKVDRHVTGEHSTPCTALRCPAGLSACSLAAGVAWQYVCMLQCPVHACSMPLRRFLESLASPTMACTALTHRRHEITAGGNLRGEARVPAATPLDHRTTQLSPHAPVHRALPPLP